MAKLAVVKQSQNEASVEDYLNGIKDERVRKESFEILKMMEKASGQKPKMWGASLIGFGKRIVTSPSSGRSVEWFDLGFAPRKGNFSLYVDGRILANKEYMKKLGKHKTGMGCLYINKLDDVDQKILKEIISRTLRSK